MLSNNIHDTYTKPIFNTTEKYVPEWKCKVRGDLFLLQNYLIIYSAYQKMWEVFSTTKLVYFEIFMNLHI